VSDPITQESLTKRSSADWAGRISRLEASQIDPVRFAQIEAKLNQFCELIIESNKSSQQSSIRNAEANERIAAHLEEGKRVWEIVNAQDSRLQILEKSFIELRVQNQNMNEFMGGVRKAAWIGITCGGILLWWIVQRYLEHGAPLK
jgi:hypothetical protein